MSINQTSDLTDNHQNLLVEKALLSSVLIDPDSLSEVDDLKVSKDDFLDIKY